MANNDLAIKFSNDVYSTKKQVADYMKTPMIDSIWNSILEYRTNFSKLTKLRHITGSNYSICLTPGVLERVNNVERKMMNLYSQYLKLIPTKANEAFKRLSYKDCLETIATVYNLNVDEMSLNRILNHKIDNISPDLMVLYHYYLCIEHILENTSKEFSKDTLKEYLSIMQGVECDSYRKTEINNALSKSVINKLYLGIPSNSIDRAISDLTLFINDPSVSVFVKVAAVIYYIFYVRPIDTFSEEIAILAIKGILASSGLEEIGACLNFEILLIKKDILEKEILESQKSLDLTYILDYLLNKSYEIIDRSFKLLGTAKASEIKEDLFQDDKKDINVMPDLSELEAKTNLRAPKEEQISSSQTINFQQKIALENIPTGLSEQEARKFEERLIEMNPNLSRGQAYFYARHCTMNMSYTIAQYKKEVGCAYETARTSMDNLVYLGYYRKELLKNKFIYIPIKRK